MIDAEFRDAGQPAGQPADPPETPDDKAISRAREAGENLGGGGGDAPEF